MEVVRYYCMEIWRPTWVNAMKLKEKMNNIGGEIIKDNEVYVVKDNKTLFVLAVNTKDP